MEKAIKIGDKEVKLSNSAAWPMEYKEQFGKDILPVIMPLISSMLETAAATFEGKNVITAADVFSAIEGRTMEILAPMFQAEFVDLVINVTWAMAKAADETIEPPKKWVKEFETFPLDEIVPEVYKLVLKGFMSSKNLKRLTSLKKSLKLIKTDQPLISTTSSSQDSSEA